MAFYMIIMFSIVSVTVLVLTIWDCIEPDTKNTKKKGNDDFFNTQKEITQEHYERYILEIR